MKRKLIALFTAATLLLTAIPASVAFAEQSTVLVNEVFDNYVTNSTEIEGITTSGIDARVVECDKANKANKAIFAKAWNEKAKVIAQFSQASERMVFQTDIMITGNTTTGNLFSLTCGTTILPLLKLNEKTLTLSDGKRICSLEYGQWHKLAVKVNFSVGMMDVYMDDKAYVTGWYLPAQGYLLPSKAEWNLTAPDEGFSCLYLDTIRIYTGSSFLDDFAFAAKPWNESRVEYTETTSLPEYNKVIGVYDFNDKAASGAVDKSSKWSWEDFGDGNKGMHFETKAMISEDPFMDTAFPEMATEQRYVIEAKIRPLELSGSSRISFMEAKDSARGGWRVGAQFSADGNILMQGTNAVFGRWTKNEWIRVALCYNISAGTVDVWTGTENSEMKLVLKGNPADDTLMPTAFRITAYVVAGGQLKFDVDDIKGYLGLTPRNVKKEDVGSAATSDRGTVMDTVDRVKTLIGNASMIMVNNETMFVNGEKKSYSVATDKPFVSSDGCFMIPLTMLDQILSCGSLWNNTTGEAIINEKWTVTTGSAKAVSSDKIVKLSKPAELINDVLYLPLRSICTDVLGKSILWDDRGFVVISDGDFQYRDSENFYKGYEPIDSIYRFMQYERPSGKEMIQAIQALHPNQGHPRLMYTAAAAEKMKASVASAVSMQTLYQKALAQANEYRKNGAAYYFKSDIADSGKQTQGLQAMNAIEILSTAYSVSGDSTYLDTISDIVSILCEYDTLGQSVSLLATGHWCAAVGLGYDITYNYLNSGAEGKQKLTDWRKKIYALAYPDLLNTYESGMGLRWYNILDNFGIVIGSGYMTLLLAIADEKDNYDETQYLMENVMKSIEYAASFFAPDGAWYEGLSYWDYSMQFFTMFYESLKNSCDTEYGFDTLPGMMQAGYAMLYGITPNGMFNFHDSDESLENDASPWMFAQEAPDVMLGKAWAKMYKQCFDNSPKTYNVRQLLWYNSAYEDTDGLSLPLDRYFRTAEYGTMRSSWETKNPTFVGIHGGFTKIPHDMLDVGEFVFEDDGIRWAKDLGNDNYSITGYWEDRGYNIYRKRTEGENCLVINPRGDYYGQELGAGSKLKFFESKPKAAMAAYDLSNIYAADAKAVTRGYYFGDDRHSLTIRDEIDLSKPNSTVYWFMHTPASISISGNKAMLTYAGKQMQVEVLCDADGFELLDMDPAPFDHVPKVDGQTPNTGRKLAVKATDSGKFSITVKLSPIRDDYIITPAEDTFIADWTLPDGEIEPPLQLSSVSVDNVALEGFSSTEKTVAVTIPVEQTGFPTITATAQEGTVSVEYGETLYDGAKITVQKPGRKTGVYNVKFVFNQNREIQITDALSNALPKAGLKNANLIRQKAWFSNSIPQPVNNPDNLSDRNFETRWSTNEDGGWVEYDFGAVKKVSGVVYATFEGALRSNRFEILYSKDGIQYSRVFSGQTSGSNEEFERLEIPGEARFVRLITHGSTVGAWASFLEFGAYTAY